jgi:hypothetical protein
MRKSTYEDERFISAQSFGGFSPWSFGTIVFGPVVRQHIMAEQNHLITRM